MKKCEPTTPPNIDSGLSRCQEFRKRHLTRIDDIFVNLMEAERRTGSRR
jgi:hypothetical protein